MANILITGGMGFIGSHLVNALSKNHVVDIVDGFNLDYVGYKYIHRGKQGLQETNEIERRHRTLNLNYRVKLIQNNFRNLYHYNSYIKLPLKTYDLIINCGALSEAILSQHFPEFTHDSIVRGLKSLKHFYGDTPCLHISSSMVYGTWEGLIDEQYSLGSVDLYGESKIKAETLCGDEDVILRPIHVYGIGDGKFSIWMNIERQIAAGKPYMIERAGCIYIDDFVATVKKIVDKWVPGIYNVGYDFVRNAEAIKAVYPNDIAVEEKLGPTGKPRGNLNSAKLRDTFDLSFEYDNYHETLKDYYGKYEDLCKEQ